MRIPRVMLAAPASGSGKTLITCGLLQVLKDKGLKPAAFKCGPDFIDPLFHREVIGVPSRNLDTYFTEPDVTRYLLTRAAGGSGIAVLEGVMGYYDGVAGTSLNASSWELAHVTQTPVILIVNGRGMSLSVLPLIEGFVRFHPQSQLRGVILNQVSASMYPDLKRRIEERIPVRVLGYLPRREEFRLKSRHLGLVTPGELSDLRERIRLLASELKKTLELEAITGLAREAPELEEEMPKRRREILERASRRPVRIGVAADEAFCFYYEDNLELLRELGARLEFFSPLHDAHLPGKVQGLLLGGGYPELYARELSQNRTMLGDIRARCGAGLPYLAECGGFLYLHETMEDMDGRAHPMAGLVPGAAYRTERLGRFGYIELTAQKRQVFGEAGGKIRGHEFHYFDSDSNGEDFRAAKPLRKTAWSCMVADEKSAAGFPHLYYESNPEFAVHFLEKCGTIRGIGV